MLRLPLRASFALALLATVMSVSWAGTNVLARFTDSASVGANTFTTAASFCTSPSTSNLTATEDAHVDADSSSNVSDENQNGASNTFLDVWADGNDRRSLVKFALPTVPADCTITSATLAFTTISGATGRTLHASRATATWTETGVTWNNQPAVATPAATASSTATVDAVVSFTVTSQLQAMYPSSAFGFVVKDSTESGTAHQRYHSSESTSTTKRPLLTVVIG